MGARPGEEKDIIFHWSLVILHFSLVEKDFLYNEK
jgi:hypothetical protein